MLKKKGGSQPKIEIGRTNKKKIKKPKTLTTPFIPTKKTKTKNKKQKQKHENKNKNKVFLLSSKKDDPTVYHKNH